MLCTTLAKLWFTMKRSTHRWKRLARLGILDVNNSDTTLLYEIVHFILEVNSLYLSETTSRLSSISQIPSQTNIRLCFLDYWWCRAKAEPPWQVHWSRHQQSLMGTFRKISSPRRSGFGPPIACRWWTRISNRDKEELYILGKWLPEGSFIFFL